jgi:hypothetical protein
VAGSPAAPPPGFELRDVAAVLDDLRGRGRITMEELRAACAAGRVALNQLVKPGGSVSTRDPGPTSGTTVNLPHWSGHEG